MSDEFLRQRHAAYATPADVLSSLIKDATGQNVQRHEKIVRGYANEVYRIWTDQGEPFVVRIRQHGDLGFQQEAWAMAQCRAAGAPVPMVYLVATVDIAGQPHEAMVLQAMPGQAVCDLQRELTTTELAAVYAQVGAALRTIHSVRVDGFGQLREESKWEFPDWASLAQAERRERESNAPTLCRAGLSTAEVEQLLRIISTMAAFECPQPVLCHGDLAAEHFFVDDQLQLTGVIDFGQFRGGPPALDFAVLLMYHPQVELAWLQHGYQPGVAFDEAFVRLLLVQQACVQMRNLVFDVQEGHAEACAAAIQGLHTTLRAWEALPSS